MTPSPRSPTPVRLERLVEAGLLLTSELSLPGVLQRVADRRRAIGSGTSRPAAGFLGW